ncbi:MAG: cyclase family protein [Desulfobacterales bacterium]|jgi:arylformamidase
MKTIDLSHRIYDGLTTHPSHPRVVINNFVDHAFTAPRYQPPCKGFATKQLIISDHAGTHVDAPTHFHVNSESIDQQSLDKYFGQAFLLDVSGKELRRPVDLELVEQTLKRDGLKVRRGDIVLIHAWSGRWDDPDFHNASGLALDAARWLTEQGIKAVGIDLGNIEDNADMTRCVHMFLLEKKVPIYENLANLSTLPVKRFLFAGFPLFLEGCTGSPVRAVALID